MGTGSGSGFGLIVGLGDGVGSGLTVGDGDGLVSGDAVGLGIGDGVAWVAASRFKSFATPTGFPLRLGPIAINSAVAATVRPKNTPTDLLIDTPPKTLFVIGGACEASACHVCVRSGVRSRT